MQVTCNPRYYIETGGGLGDLIQSYCLFSGFRLLPVIKSLEPDAYFRVIDRNVNSSADDFFRYHPLINHVVHLPFSHIPTADANDPHREGCAHVQTAIDRFRLGPGDYVEPRVYLNDQESRFVEDIRAKGPYVAVHPFTWDDTRSMTKFVTIVEMCALIKERGFNVVILGGTCLNTANGNRLYKYQVDLEGDRVINLVNKAAVRTAIAVSMNATKYVGSNSCFAMASVSAGVPTLCFAYDSRRAEMANQPPEGLMRRMEFHYSNCGIDPKEQTREFLCR